jgi:TonB family protein
MVVPASAPAKTNHAAGVVFRPVEILAKPKPAYTEEARRLGVEGEVIVEAMFTAAGQIHVLKTLRGLGHGLDENALRAAEAIRFRPAERDGQPVDFTAAIHIIFQLVN